MYTRISFKTCHTSVTLFCPHLFRWTKIHSRHTKKKILYCHIAFLRIESDVCDWWDHVCSLFPSKRFLVKIKSAYAIFFSLMSIASTNSFNPYKIEDENKQLAEIYRHTHTQDQYLNKWHFRIILFRILFWCWKSWKEKSCGSRSCAELKNQCQKWFEKKIEFRLCINLSTCRVCRLVLLLYLTFSSVLRLNGMKARLLHISTYVNLCLPLILFSSPNFVLLFISISISKMAIYHKHLVCYKHITPKNNKTTLRLMFMPNEWV